VVAVNEELVSNPEKINQAPYDTWIFKFKPSDPAELQALLDATGYEKLVEAESH
jgi:glycine cleavage system H protein